MSTKSGNIVLNIDERVTCSSCGQVCRYLEEREVVVNDEEQVYFYCESCVRNGKNEEGE